MKVKVAVRNECSNTCTNALQCPQDVIIREGCGEKNPEKCDLLPKPPRTPPLRAKNIPFLLVVKLFLDISEVRAVHILRQPNLGVFRPPLPPPRQQWSAFPKPPLPPSSSMVSICLTPPPPSSSFVSIYPTPLSHYKPLNSSKNTS